MLRDGARRLLISALEAEVENYIEQHKSVCDADGRRLVVRNGRSPARTIQTGIGNIEVEAPRVNDRREGVSFYVRPPLERAFHSMSVPL